jgi:hypothetical protein
MTGIQSGQKNHDYIQYESYSEGIITDVESLIERARTKLVGIDYDTMAGQGLSGSLIIPMLARELDKHFFIVRKDGESSHSYEVGVGRIGKRWVFVDDFICSGKTRIQVRQNVEIFCRERRWHSTFVGSFLYKDEGGSFQRADHLTHMERSHYQSAKSAINVGIRER